MGKFKFTQMQVPGMVLIEPQTFGDARGYFMETYHKQEFAAAGITASFVQDNQSSSAKGVLRGLHFQKYNTQGKLVRVLRGAVYDVGVDVRPNSPAFGRWAAAQLTEENRHMLYVPPGFAHGFLVLSETAEFSYKCTDVYTPEAEGGVRFDDADIGIPWPQVDAPICLSDKDRALPGFAGQDFSYFERWYNV